MRGCALPRLQRGGFAASTVAGTTFRRFARAMTAARGVDVGGIALSVARTRRAHQKRLPRRRSGVLIACQTSLIFRLVLVKAIIPFRA